MVLQAVKWQAVDIPPCLARMGKKSRHHFGIRFGREVIE